MDAYVSIETLEDAEAQVQVNHSLAAGYVNALHELAQRYNLRDDLSVSTLSRYSEIFSVHKAPEDEDAIWRIVQQGADFAMESFLAMREREEMCIRDRCNLIRRQPVSDLLCAEHLEFYPAW